MIKKENRAYTNNNTLSSFNIIYSIILNIHFKFVESRSKKVRVIFIHFQFIPTSVEYNSFMLVYFFSALIVFEIVRFFPHHKPGGHCFSKASNDELPPFCSSSAAFSSVMALFFPHHRWATLFEHPLVGLAFWVLQP